MKCYYEELAVARDANDADIKSAYRKLALRWHPDKNPDCLEEAKERFQLIQQAYEVLSDAHERTWYDNHREQILHGKNSDYSDNCLDVFQYFTVSCYKGYGDDTQGFYAVYREVFAKIACEDAEFMGEEELLDIPKFGDSQSSYEEVVGPFYAYWQSYFTKKSYTWLCPYDVQEIRDRRVLREIEKDLKKVVQKAKRERNEEVRNLVSFVRKRDKRVQANKRLLEERAALNRKKQEQNRLEQIRKRQQELKEMRENSSHQHHNENYEELLKQLEQQYSGDSSTEEEDSGEAEVDGNGDEDDVSYVDELYCVACNKAFKNEKALANHETSKKHRENMARLKLEMQKEEEDYWKALTDEESGANGVEDADSDLADEVELSEEEVPKEEDEVQPELGPETVIQNKKGKKAKKGNSGTASRPPTTTACSDDEETATHDFIAQAKAEDNSDAEDWGSATKKNARKSKTKNRQNKKSTEPRGNWEMVKEQLPSQTEATAAVANTTLENNDDANTPTHSCATCRATFPSKNKLFAHLKLTNHVVYIPKAKAATDMAAESVKQKKTNKGKRK